jgi:hypothetical protein
MCKQSCCTAYPMSGRVIVRYCNAPAILRYEDASCIGMPSVLDVLGFVSAGVDAGLQFDILARSRRSVAY